MYDTVAYIYKDYRIEFKEEGYHVYGEAFYPGEVLPVGTITGHSYNSKDENDISHMKDNSLHIDMLIVSEKHNGKGVGSTLMKMMMLYVEKRKFKHVTTNPTPIDGRTTKQLEKFYHKFHFSTGIMIKRIEFVDDKDMFELDSDENSEEEFETQKIKNINHDVEKAVSSQKSGSYQEEEVIEGLQPVEKIELKENIQAALRVLDEEAHKIEMKKVMLEEISNANGIEESLYELEQDVELKQEATNKRTASDNVKISLKQDDNKKKQKLKTECKISDKLEDDFTKEGKDDYAEHLKEKTGSEEKAASQVNHIPNSYNIGILTTIYYVE